MEQVLCLVRLLGPGQVFIDVGGNVGFYSLLGSRLVQDYGRVFAFEPMPRNVALLHRHIGLNQARNIRIFSVACADRIATELFYEGANYALGHLAENDQGQLRQGAILSATTTLDTAVEKLGIRPHVIKIDVEGAELRERRTF